MIFIIGNLKNVVERLQQMSVRFLRKNGEIIYHVENGALFKLIAPEGTIIELRNHLGI